ncbi:MAG: BglII/BstYI family type II restriction endonuclease, partial [Pseudomonadota bacterium]
MAGLILDRLRAEGFDVAACNHAEAILSVDFPGEAAELVGALCDFRLDGEELIAGGGGEAPSTIRLRRALAKAGWQKHHFRIETTVDGVARGLGTSHEIDHVRRGAAGLLALEIEWNNKDPFFDRDLENFQRLHAQSVISVGVIVTRGQALQSGLQGMVAAMIAERGI